MSIQKRTVSEPREAEVVVCDGPGCAHSVSAEAWTHGGAPGWIALFRYRESRPGYERSDILSHFCSYGCLALWAEQRAMPHAVDVQP